MNMLVAVCRLIAGQLARLYGFDASHRLTLAIETGMQNTGLALVLAHFASETALPGASSWLRQRGSARQKNLNNKNREL